VNFKLSATNAAQPAFNQFNRGLRGIQKAQRATTTTGRSWNAGLNSNRRAVQQFGYQMSDFAIQIAGGQSAMLAFTQQGGQMLQFFGPAGAIAAALVAVFGSLAIAFTKSGKALSDLFPLMGVLQDDFRGLGRAIGSVKEIMLDFTNVVVNNLDVILISLALVTGYFATRWVNGFLIARVSTMEFVATLRLAGITMSMFGARATAAMIATSLWTTSLKILRTAFIRLGIPALIISMGYLIERFMALSSVVGGAGNLFRLLGDVIRGWGEKATYAVAEFVARTMVHWTGLKASWMWMLGDMVESMTEWANKTIGAFVGAKDAIVVVWGAIPSVIGEAMYSTVNVIIGALTKLIDKSIDGVNLLITVMNKVPGVDIPELDALGESLQITNEYAGATAAAIDGIAEAFNNATSATYVGEGESLAETLFGKAEALNETTALWAKAADSIANLANKPIASWEEFMRVWEEAKDTKIDVRTWFDGSGGGDSASGAAKEEADRIKKIFDDMAKSISSSMLSGFKALLDGSKSFGEAARDILGNILDKVIDLLMTPVFNSIAGGLTSGIQGLLGGLGASFEGGGFTGVGPRAGGMDGKGGSLAMVHPNETVVDHTKGQSSGGGVTIHMNINTPDAESFRKSGSQIQAELARAVQMGALAN